MSLAQLDSIKFELEKGEKNGKMFKNDDTNSLNQRTLAISEFGFYNSIIFF